MVERYLGEDLAASIFEAGASSSMEKSADWLEKLIGAPKKGGEGFLDLMKSLSLLGLTVGTTGGVAYNIVKDRMTRRSPEEVLQDKKHAIYSSKTRELEDARWMDRVTAMRNELVRNHKKMSPDEYERKYNELVSALDERAVE